MATAYIAHSALRVHGISKPIIARFDQPHASSGGGAILLGRNSMATDRRRLLVAAVGFARVAPRGDMPELEPRRRWLGSWSGIGAVAAGMARQGYDVQLTKYADEGWRANFYPTGIAHSIVIGSGWAPTPW